MLAAPLLLSVVVELPLLVLSDGWPRRRVLGAALWACCAATALAAFASSGWTLALALATWGVGTGVASGVSQAALIDAEPNAAERALTRWALSGMLGDALAPALVAVAAVVCGSWRLAFTLLALLYAGSALGVARVPLPAAREASSDESNPLGLVQAVRAGLTNTRLVLWLCGSALCGLLDETLVAFGSLFLRDELGATPIEQGLAFVAFAVGAGVGLLFTHRLLISVAPLRLLAASSGLCGLVYLAWLAVGSTLLSSGLLFFVGVLTAPLYPIAHAQAYAACPERPGLVAALSQLSLPIEVAVPVLLGYLADEFGLRAALLVLVAQPIGLLLLAFFPAGGQRPRS